MPTITRRTFISRTAATLAVAPVAAAAHAGEATRDQQSPAAGTDLIIVGAGLAGLSAAITAADEGASVLLIDKRYKPGGSAMGAGGSYSAAGSRQQREKQIDDAPARHFEDANRIGKGKADPALLRLYTEQAAAVQAWLEGLGVQFDPKGPRIAYEHEPYTTARTCDAVGGGPGFIAALMTQLQRRIDAGTVQLRGETAARSLIVRNGRVTGLSVTGPDGQEETLPARAVLLACGGYGSNREMIAKHNPAFANALTVASKYATGDGIRMADAAGAAIVNMDLLAPYFAGVENPPGSRRTLMISLISGIVPNFKGDIWISRLGTRFMNEDSKSPDERERALRTIPEAAVFALFDDAMLKASKPPLFGFDVLLEEGRVVKTANTIAALADAIGVPTGALVKTIETYNGYVAAGKDLDFGRTDLVAFRQPPYYAIAASGVIFMTMGGVKTNDRLQAVDKDGRVVPGLYAAGEVMGAAQWMGDGLMSGAGNGAALVFGRLAAQAAVKDAGRGRA